MPIDINQFLPTFIEESMEMLQEAEEILLHLNLTTLDLDKINQLFRLMHSIKGNSSAFNFNAIDELTHVLETFLDSIRSKEKSLTANNVSLLLKAIDCLREIIKNISNKSEIDDTEEKKLAKMIEEQTGVPIVEVSSENKPLKQKLPELSRDDSNSDIGWYITFCPDQNCLQMGNDPFRLITVLSELGKLTVEVDTTRLPELTFIDPTKCYLSWRIKLYGNITKKELEDIFSWVTNQENISIRPLLASEKTMTSEKPSVMRQDNILPSSKENILSPPTSIRVSTAKIDSLINLIGELTIIQSVLNQIVKNFDMSLLTNLNQTLEELEESFRELHSSIMHIRMVPIDFLFSRFPRMIHDNALKLEKQIEVNISGEQTELDKNMIEKLTNPMLHLIRNAIDHGIELPKNREKQGKSPIGTIQLNAYQEGSNIIIEVSDDGAGLNKNAIYQKGIAMNLIQAEEEINDDQIYKLIFHPGFSTSRTASELSGRGVGLDVVANSIYELGGDIDVISSEGKGTTFRLCLPLTLAIMDCQLVKIGSETYIIPLSNITEIIEIEKCNLNSIDENTRLYYFREKYIPIIILGDFFSIADHSPTLSNQLLIIADVKDQLFGFVIDEVLSQQQVVIKNLEENYGKIIGISGVTVLGNGHIALIIDVKAIIDLFQNPQLKKNNHISNNTKVVLPDTIQYDSNTPSHFLTFIISKKEFAVDMSEVKEIRMMENITPLPNAPTYLKGAINVRGTIIPIIDLQDRFVLTDQDHGSLSVIIILSIKNENQYRYIGIIADQVLEAHIIQNNKIMLVPTNTYSEHQEYIRGLITIDDKMITLLNTRNLLELITEQEIAS